MFLLHTIGFSRISHRGRLQHTSPTSTVTSDLTPFVCKIASNLWKAFGSELVYFHWREARNKNRSPAETIMRVLLARRFRGNRNAAQLLKEEGEDQQAEVGEEKEEEEESSSVVRFSQGQQKPQQAQSKATKHNTKSQQPREKLLFTGKDSCENISPQQPLSVVSQKNLKPSPQRKRRLAKSSQEEIICKLRRLQNSVSSTTKEEASFLDRKPSARGSGIVNKDTNRTLTFKFNPPKVIEATGENTTTAENSPSSPISETAALPTSRSNPTKENNTHNMVSNGAGQDYQRNSREREEEEHLLNWQYNHHPHHAVGRRRTADREEAEIIVQPSSEAGLEGPLENDPASARGDFSSASPERQRDDNGHNSPNSSSSFVIGRREGSPSLGGGVTRNRYDNQDWIASVPRNASIPRNRRHIPRIASAPGSEQGTNLSKISSPIGGTGSNSKKRASSAAEEIRFREVLKKERGLEIKEQDGDGNCLFRAISLQVYGDPSMHGDVRKKCMDHMVSNFSMRLEFEKVEKYPCMMCTSSGFCLNRNRCLCSSYGIAK